MHNKRLLEGIRKVALALLEAHDDVAYEQPPLVYNAGQQQDGDAREGNVVELERVVVVRVGSHRAVGAAACVLHQRMLATVCHRNMLLL